MYDYDHRQASVGSLKPIVEAIRDLSDSVKSPEELSLAKRTLHKALTAMSGPDACFSMLKAMKHTGTSIAEMLNIIQSRI